MRKSEVETEDDLEEMLEQHEEDYNFFSEKLISAVEQRETFVKLLKIAPPDKLADVREAIAAADNLIEKIEDSLEFTADLIRKNKELSQRLAEIAEFNDRVDVELIKYVEKNCPERLEEIEILLFEDGTSH